MSNCYCHPGRAGGSPLLVESPPHRNWFDRLRSRSWFFALGRLSIWITRRITAGCSVSSWMNVRECKQMRATTGGGASTLSRGLCVVALAWLLAACGRGGDGAGGTAAVDVITGLPADTTVLVSTDNGQQLYFAAPGVAEVEIHLDKPWRQRIARFSADRGRAATGDWIRDGMRFDLQDRSSGNSTSAADTLAVATVDRQPSRQRYLGYYRADGAPAPPPVLGLSDLVLHSVSRNLQVATPFPLPLPPTRDSTARSAGASFLLLNAGTQGTLLSGDTTRSGPRAFQARRWLRRNCCKRSVFGAANKSAGWPSSSITP